MQRESNIIEVIVKMKIGQHVKQINKDFKHILTTLDLNYCINSLLYLLREVQECHFCKLLPAELQI